MGRTCATYLHALNCIPEAGSSGGLYSLPLDHATLVFSLPLDHYNSSSSLHQPIAMLVFSLPVNTTITGLTISDNEFWKTY
jgi:hypothetical protein